MGFRFVGLLIGAVILCAGMIYQATTESSSTVYLPSELLERSGTAITRVRVGGRVSAGEVTYNVLPRLTLSFSVIDPPAKEGELPTNPSSTSEKPLKVFYHGPKPDMFSAGRDVIIDGNFDGEALHAVTLLTQCPSKYEPPVDAGAASPSGAYDSESK